LSWLWKFLYALREDALAIYVDEMKKDNGMRFMRHINLDFNIMILIHGWYIRHWD
jgi:hypothetical protein